MDANVVHDLDIDDYPTKKNWEADEVEKRWPRKDRVMMLIDNMSEEARVLFGTPHDKECDDDGRYSKKLFDFANYQLDMVEHEGFDLGVLPNGMKEPGNIAPSYHPPHRMKTPKFVDELTDCARLAIEAYNLKHDANFDNVLVLKANAQAMAPIRYYITFEATDEKKNLTLTFQTIVDYKFPLCDTNRIVNLVRIKPPFKPLPLLEMLEPDTRDDNASAVN